MKVEGWSGWKDAAGEGEVPQRSEPDGLTDELCENPFQSKGWRTEDPIALFRKPCEVWPTASAVRPHRWSSY